MLNMQSLLQKNAVLVACLSTSMGMTMGAAQSFADLPTGTYRYTRSNSERLMRKSGSVVIGIEMIDGGDGIARENRPSLVRSCFRGQAVGDRLIHTTQVSPPYSPAADWQSNQTILLVPSAVHLAIDGLAPTPAEQTALQECVQAFWR